MAQLKDTTITGDLSVSGTVNTLTHIDNIDSTNIIKIEFAKLLDPTQLNAEVTLVTIPAGYVGRLSHMSSIAYIGVSYYQNDSVSQNATVTIYYTPETPGTEDATYGLEFGNITATTINLNPWISENSTIRAKIITAGVGHTRKILLEGVIYLQKL